jgi:protein SCO1/2
MAVQPPPPAEPSEPPASGGLSPRTVLTLIVILVIAGGVAVLTMGNGSKHPTIGNIHTARSASYDGSVLTPISAAPPLALHNYKGEMVNINQYRGKAVLVTFLYTHCPDVCPLIASNLRVAQNMMGQAESSKAQAIAVSVDPRGDNPKTVAAFLAAHGMTGRMQYLIGSARELAPVWKAWGVGSEQDAQQPQFVNHTGIIYGVSAAGKRTTVYLASFAPKEIAHDVPLLASS